MTDHSSSKTKYFILALVFFVIISFAGGLYLGLSSRYRLAPILSLDETVATLAGQNKEVNFTLFKEVWETIKEKYVDQPINEQEMLYGALTGLVASLGDPYSSFLDPALSEAFIGEIVGSFEGIGAEIGIKNGQLVVIAPLNNSPAEKAGLKAKDKIFAIDEVETGDLSLDYATSLIRGEKGTKVTLLIQHEGEEEAQEITITRETINIESVEWSLKTAGVHKIGYLKISNFNDDTLANVKKAANNFNLNGIKGLIVDLRDNSGGYLETTVAVASEFIEEGVILTEQFSNNETKPYLASGHPTLNGYPMVVLINGGSASASEILAGALKEHDLATLVGEKSYGKGSVQEYEQLFDGSSLKITTAKWLTPDGNSIDQNGIEPDIMVELTLDDFNNDRDPQLDKAFEVLSGQINE